MIAELATAAALRVTMAPERFRLGPGAAVTLTVRAPGATGVDVSLAVAGYALDGHGRPQILERAPVWVRVAPASVALRAHATARVRVTAAVPAPAAPGDHTFVVLASVRDPRRSGSSVLVRLGAVAVVRVPGRVRRHVVLLGPPVAARGRLRLAVANRGNVMEWLPPGALDVTLRQGRRRIAVLRSLGRHVLPGARAVFEWRIPAGVRGPVVARVALGRRIYRLRL